jgi:hypothetical protein
MPFFSTHAVQLSLVITELQKQLQRILEHAFIGDTCFTAIVVTLAGKSYLMTTKSDADANEKNAHTVQTTPHATLESNRLLPGLRILLVSAIPYIC